MMFYGLGLLFPCHIVAFLKLLINQVCSLLYKKLGIRLCIHLNIHRCNHSMNYYNLLCNQHTHIYTSQCSLCILLHNRCIQIYILPCNHLNSNRLIPISQPLQSQDCSSKPQHRGVAMPFSQLP